MHASRSTTAKLLFEGWFAGIEHHGNGGTVASVCSGAVALGAAGLLDGRCFTTHHELQEALALSFPKANILRHVLFVEDDRVVTLAGIASGIDLALRLVAVEHGPAVASRVARAMAVFSRRNGHDQQQSVMLRHRGHLSDAVHRAQDIIDDGFTQTLRLTDVAGKIGTSERTLTRQFTKVTGLTPLRYQPALRLEKAEHQLGQGATMDPRRETQASKTPECCAAYATVPPDSWWSNRFNVGACRSRHAVAIPP